MKVKNVGWSGAFSGSIIFHVALLVFVGYSAFNFSTPVQLPSNQPVEVTLVAEGGHEGGGPAVSAPEASKVAIPAPPTPEEARLYDEQAVPTTETTTKPVAAQSAVQNGASSNATANGTASGSGGGGTGAGSGTGDGFGSGEGSGDGLGSGDAPPSIEGAAVLSSHEPSIPKGILANGESRVASYSVTIGVNGRAAAVETITSSGHSELDELGRQDIMSNWRFRPQTVNGSPVEVTATVSLEFHRNS